MFRTTLALALALSAAGPAVSSTDVPRIHWEPYAYETRDGDPVNDCELGRLTVPERHGKVDGATIELAFVRFRSTAQKPAAPIPDWLPHRIATFLGGESVAETTFTLPLEFGLPDTPDDQ